MLASVIFWDRMFRTISGVGGKVIGFGFVCFVLAPLRWARSVKLLIFLGELFLHGFLHCNSVLGELGLEALQILLQLDHAALRLRASSWFLVIDIIEAVKQSIIFKNGFQVHFVGEVVLGGDIGVLVSFLDLRPDVVDQFDGIQEIQVCRSEKNTLARTHGRQFWLYIDRACSSGRNTLNAIGSNCD